jgi:hypothetical protein
MTCLKFIGVQLNLAFSFLFDLVRDMLQKSVLGFCQTFNQKSVQKSLTNVERFTVLW